MFADLHVHSSFSDGTDTPLELIALAKIKKVSALALTDHDTTQGQMELITVARQNGIAAIPGVEISTAANGIKIHILGYFINLHNQPLQQFLYEISQARTANTQAILAGLNRLSLLQYSWDNVLRLNPNQAWLHSSHIFRAMMKEGYYTAWREWPDFYRRYFSTASPAYQNIDGFSADDAIRVILAAGGLPVLAHPKLIGDDHRIKPLIDNGLMGIEAYYPAHQSADVNRYLDIAKKYGLIVTGGTDWHGNFTEWDVELGDCGIDEARLKNMVSLKGEVEM